MIRADLHIHTSHSPDASIHPKTIIEELNKHPTIKAAAITDHNTMEGYIKAKELAEDYTDIVLIPGAEISAIEGEIIILGLEQLPPTPWRVENVVNHAHANGGVVIAVHPYRGFGLGDLTRSFNVDAIETLNAITPLNLNKQAEDLAKVLNLPGVAGTDAHKPDELWTVSTEIRSTSEVSEILAAIRQGNTKAVLEVKSIRF